MAGKQITSLTLKAVNNFIKTASFNQTLSCNQITGFEVVKTQKSASYRYRYTSPDGKRKRSTISKVSELKPNEAAQKALELQNSIDPLKDKEKEKEAYIAEIRASEARGLLDYLNGLYTRHQMRKRSGRDTLNIIRNNFGHLSDKDMSQVSVADIKQWQMKREQDGIKFETIKRAYGALRNL